ncbi:MAG: hypothetical protein LBK08_02050 [Treponema sp.]|jgi:hypothetical protein|nr:hypothetical protein [Treponema sp.]
MNIITPEKRNYIDDNYSDFYVRTLPNNVKEYYSKEVFNKDFTRKTENEDIEKEILLFMINELLKE